MSLVECRYIMFSVENIIFMGAESAPKNQLALVCYLSAICENITRGLRWYLLPPERPTPPLTPLGLVTVWLDTSNYTRKLLESHLRWCGIDFNFAVDLWIVNTNTSPVMRIINRAEYVFSGRFLGDFYLCS